MRPPAPLNRSDRSLGHAKQQEALPRGVAEICIADPAYRQIFRLCTRPFRHQDIGERCALANHIARRTRVDTLDEAPGPRLNDGDIALVELDRTGRREARAQRPGPRLRDAQAE